MNISIDNESRQYVVQSAAEMNAHWINISREVLSRNDLIYCVDIDGVSYYDDYATELLARYEEIQNVVIHTITKERSFYTTWNDFQDYTNRVVSVVVERIAPLYGGAVDETGEIVSELTGSIEWISNALTFMAYLGNEIGVGREALDLIDDTTAQIKPILELLAGELEWGNLIGFADIIQYEFIPLIEEYYCKSKEVELPSGGLKN
ncbi:hypothetical protein NDS46_27335 [Paenibacillus thiaminolyticus]|uniref:hypothetical protein n=1 Tax=Paenibacillus thiaminolyticus TaxID=49283 RepID=UPI00232E272E|nr:hypothetical protein [Paenibacillus thiaminolyticus]WCF07933.1 hypothetical protein NDS46_27335 [Paenibacillus thiaminolyticus]